MIRFNGNPLKLSVGVLHNKSAEGNYSLELEPGSNGMETLTHSPAEMG